MSLGDMLWYLQSGRCLCASDQCPDFFSGDIPLHIFGDARTERGIRAVAGLCRRRTLDSASSTAGVNRVVSLNASMPTGLVTSGMMAQYSKLNLPSRPLVGWGRDLCPGSRLSSISTLGRRDDLRREVVVMCLRDESRQICRGSHLFSSYRLLWPCNPACLALMSRNARCSARR